jgi:hypothetical protein
MKRRMPLILVLILLVDLAEDNCLGNLKVYLPHPSYKTTVTSSQHHGSNKTAFQHELAFIDLLVSPWHGNDQPVNLRGSAYTLSYSCPNLIKFWWHPPAKGLLHLSFSERSYIAIG